MSWKTSETLVAEETVNKNEKGREEAWKELRRERRKEIRTAEEKKVSREQGGGEAVRD